MHNLPLCRCIHVQIAEIVHLGKIFPVPTELALNKSVGSSFVCYS